MGRLADPDRPTAEQLRDLARAHGTRGEYCCLCPRCGYQWLAEVRWNAQVVPRRWQLLTALSAYCRRCWHEWALLTIGSKFDRMRDYEGSWDPGPPTDYREGE